ncbi:hypothetical protein V8G54_005855 [Vigna mungo]|uniref:Retroviral polymerase SH3-like domain-containing protein n=1 Tax=Vigna mungo TaxID=3915 RepID=A0AAQ3P287_VIGMU
MANFDISGLRVFGCLCCISTITANRKKLDARVVLGIFFGFKPHTKGYQFLNLQNHKINISRNVFFHEYFFPYTSSLNNTHDSNSLSLPVPHNYHHDYNDINFPNNHVLVSTPNDHVTNTNEDTIDVQNIVASDLTNASSDDVSNVHEHNEIIIRSTRSKRPPAYLKISTLTTLLGILLLILFLTTSSLLISGTPYYVFPPPLNLAHTRKHLKFLSGPKPCRMNSKL